MGKMRIRYKPPFYIGGTPCLDFGNTLDHLHDPPNYDFIPDYATYLEWGKASGILPPDMQTGPSLSAQSMDAVRETRVLLLRLFLPLVRVELPVDADLAVFNDRLKQAYSGMRLVPSGDGYKLMFTADNPSEQILRMVIRSAADLLLAGNLDRIKQCPECGWLFCDSSHNHLRRWCEMRICGNRAKARRHYERVRNKRVSSAGRKSRPKVARAGNS
jgi:predicted RNA-binding Zn ribbon-like protein